MDSSEITLHQFFALKEDALSAIESSKGMEALKEKTYLKLPPHPPFLELPYV